MFSLLYGHYLWILKYAYFIWNDSRGQENTMHPWGGAFKGVAIEHTGIKCQKRKHETEGDTLRGERRKIENGRNKQH